MLLIRILWRLVRLPRPLVRLLWRLVRRRWLRRLLFWLGVRMVRKSGWRRTARLLFRGRRHWRLLVKVVWRATLGVLLLSRRTFRLIGWLRAHRPRSLGGQHPRKALRTRAVPRLRAADARSGRQSAGEPRITLKRRVAQRRDVIRRSLLASVGVDPNWRPARRPPNGGAAAIGREQHPELSDAVSR
jgi:hypothetical protein